MQNDSAGSRFTVGCQASTKLLESKSPITLTNSSDVSGGLTSPLNLEPLRQDGDGSGVDCRSSISNPTKIPWVGPAGPFERPVFRASEGASSSSVQRSAVQRRTPNGRRERTTAARRCGRSPRRRGIRSPPSGSRGVRPLQRLVRQRTRDRDVLSTEGCPGSSLPLPARRRDAVAARRPVRAPSLSGR